MIGAILLVPTAPMPRAWAAGPQADAVVTPRSQQQRTESVGCPNGGAPDVDLDVPKLTIEQVKIAVERLRARLDLEARVGSLLEINAGVDASADSITIEIGKVDAQLSLRICLGTVEQIIDRTLTTIDRNPQILEGLLSRLDGLLSQTVNQLGQAVVRTVDAAGNIVEKTLDNGANVIGQNVVGNVSSLPVISETTNSVGQTVRRVQDSSGAVIEVVQDAAGQIVRTRVITPVNGGRR